MIQNDDSRRLQEALGEDYELLGSIGHGGMGAVYKARHRKLDRLVAVKIVRRIGDFSADPNATRRLTNEAQALAALKHDNIVQALTLQPLADGGQAMIMDYVEGRDLGAVIGESGTLDAQRARKLFSQCASALAAAHSVGIIHRDIKPGNLLVTCDAQGDETVKVLDFGLAKFMESTDQKLTKTGTIMGSPAYMSPEQCSASTDLDGRTDIYSLGCVFFEALTGRPPFEADSAFEVLMKHTVEDVPEVACPDAALSAVIKKCTQRDPDNRFATAFDLVEALRQSNFRYQNNAAPNTRRKRIPLRPVLTAALCCSLLAGVAALVSTSRSVPLQQTVHHSPAFDQFPPVRLIEYFDKHYSLSNKMPPPDLLDAIRAKDDQFTNPDNLKTLAKCFERLGNSSGNADFKKEAAAYFERAVDGYHQRGSFSRFEVTHAACYYAETGQFNKAEDLLRRDSEWTRRLPETITKKCYVAKTIFNDLSLAVCRKDWKRAQILHDQLAEAYKNDARARAFVDSFDTVGGDNTDNLALYAGTFRSKFYPAAQTKEPGKPGL